MMSALHYYYYTASRFHLQKTEIVINKNSERITIKITRSKFSSVQEVKYALYQKKMEICRQAYHFMILISNIEKALH